jgi:hypothetical protein
MVVLLLTDCMFGEHWEVPVTSSSAVLTHTHHVGVPQQLQHFYNALGSVWTANLKFESCDFPVRLARSSGRHQVKAKITYGEAY